jgi:hypothetical protein
MNAMSQGTPVAFASILGLEPGTDRHDRRGNSTDRFDISG